MLDKLVEQNYQQLNENDLYIWQYILHHKNECQKMSINDLAHQCNVSHTSILRFAKKIGLEGFSELKFHLKIDSQQWLDFDREAIQETYQDFNDTMQMMINRDFTKIMEMIDNAQRIFVYGTGVVQEHMARELRREFVYTKKIFQPVYSIGISCRKEDFSRSN